MRKDDDLNRRAVEEEREGKKKEEVVGERVSSPLDPAEQEYFFNAEQLGVGPAYGIDLVLCTVYSFSVDRLLYIAENSTM